MSNISDKLIQLSNIKSDIKTAINNKGQSVGDDFSTYANAIDNITTGDGPVYENPDFYELRTQGGTNFKGLFSYCNVPSIDVSKFDTSKATNMSYMFYNCSTVISGIENWDTSNVTDMQNMFYYFTNKSTYLDLSPLDFSSVNKVNYMFTNSNTDYLDVRNINLTGATSYERLFNQCNGTELDLSSWDISKVTSLSYTFNQSKYTKIDLTGWNTVNVTNMGNCFYYASNLITLIIPDWDMTNATSTGSMFSSASKLKYIDASRCNDTTITKLASALLTKTQAAYGEIVVRPDLSQAAIDALIAKYWRPIGPKLDLISTELALELDEIKPGKTTKVWTGNNNPWYGADGLEYIEFISSDESVATVNGREITSTGVDGTVEISARNKETQAILGTKTLTVSETDSNPNLIKFRTNGNEGTNILIQVDGTNFSKSKCTYDSITNIYSYDPGKQITSIRFVASPSYMYTNEIIKFNFNAANITDMTNMFSYFQGTTLDLSDWDTSNVTRMRAVFSYCSNLREIIGEIDLSLAAELGYASPFTACRNLETVYLKNIYKNRSLTNYGSNSIDLGETKVKDECLLYIINELPNLYDKGITNNTEIVFTLPKTNTLTDEQKQVARDKNWIVVN